MPQDPKQYAAQLLDRLKHLDYETSSAFYEMGQILSAIAHSKLYDVLGYTSLAELVEEELSFTNTTAYKYLHTYRHFRRLGYTKTEALDLIRTYSFTNVARWLPTATVKVGKRAVGNAVHKMLVERQQINFCLSAEDREYLIKALKQFGAEETDYRLQHSSEALVALCKAVVGNGQPKLKLVG